MGTDLDRRRRQLELARDAHCAGSTDAAGSGPADGVRASWDRCAVVPAAALAPVGQADAVATWDASPIRQVGGDLLEHLGAIATSEDYVAAVTDAQGDILWSVAGRSMSRRAEKANFVRGARWDEAAAGTNALGMVLHTKQPSTVFSAEHWCDSVQEWVCYAAPVRTPEGGLLGVLDISSTWRRASPLAMATVTAMARAIEVQLRHDVGAGPGAASDGCGPDLELRVLGDVPEARLRGVPVHLTTRQLEVLLALAVRGPLGLAALHEHLYGEREVSRSTLKAEVSHLRQLLGGGIASRPYRLTVDVSVDVTRALGALRRGDAATALDAYKGELLPASDSPFVAELRHHLEVALRTALLQGGSPHDLLAFADVHPYDLEVLEVAQARAVHGSAEPALRGEVHARLDRARRG